MPSLGLIDAPAPNAQAAPPNVETSSAKHPKYAALEGQGSVKLCSNEGNGTFTLPKSVTINLDELHSADNYEFCNYAIAKLEREEQRITEDQALNNAAKQWSKEGRQTKQYRTAVIQCLELGFFSEQIARHIAGLAYPDSTPSDSLKKKISVSVSNIKYYQSKKSKTIRSSKAATAKVLMPIMNQLDLDKESNERKNNKKAATDAPKFSVVL